MLGDMCLKNRRRQTGGNEIHHRVKELASCGKQGWKRRAAESTSSVWCNWLTPRRKGDLRAKGNGIGKQGTTRHTRNQLREKARRNNGRNCWRRNPLAAATRHAAGWGGRTASRVREYFVAGGLTNVLHVYMLITKMQYGYLLWVAQEVLHGPARCQPPHRPG